MICSQIYTFTNNKEKNIYFYRLFNFQFKPCKKFNCKLRHLIPYKKDEKKINNVTVKRSYQRLIRLIVENRFFKFDNI